MSKTNKCYNRKLNQNQESIPHCYHYLTRYKSAAGVSCLYSICDIPSCPIVPHGVPSAWKGNRSGGSEGKQSVRGASWLPADKCVAPRLYVEQQPAAISISVKDTATGECALCRLTHVVLIGAELDTRWKQLQRVESRVSAHLALCVWFLPRLYISPSLLSRLYPPVWCILSADPAKKIKNKLCLYTEPPSFLLPHWVSPFPLTSCSPQSTWRGLCF